VTSTNGPEKIMLVSEK